MNSSRLPIKVIIAEAKPALDALRFFTATTRGFRDKEQIKLAAFLRETCKLEQYTPDEVKDWLKTKAGFVDTSDYRRGDFAGYLSLLRRIPANLVDRTRDYATTIAGGSGRRPLSDELRERVNSEFSENPVVSPPASDDTLQLGVRISFGGTEEL